MRHYDAESTSTMTLFLPRTLTSLATVRCLYNPAAVGVAVAATAVAAATVAAATLVGVASRAQQTRLGHAARGDRAITAMAVTSGGAAFTRGGGGLPATAAGPPAIVALADRLG